MHICICVGRHVCMYVCTYIYIYKYITWHMYIQTNFIYACIHTCVRMYAYRYTDMHVDVCIHIYFCNMWFMYVYTHILMFICVYTFIHRLPNCLCIINTRQVELLLWRARSYSPTYCKIAQSSLYSWVMQIVWKIRCCHFYVNSPADGGTLKGIQNPLIQWRYLGKLWEQDVGLLGLALPSSSSNCLVLILHREVETVCSVLGRAIAQQLNISQDFI